jgi:hypothetical protein
MNFKSKVVIGTYQTPKQVEDSLSGLLAQGIEETDVSLLMPNSVEPVQFSGLGTFFHSSLEEALSQSGLSEIECKRFEKKFHEGKSIMAVSADSESESKISQFLRDSGAEDICSTKEVNEHISEKRSPIMQEDISFHPTGTV